MATVLKQFLTHTLTQDGFFTQVVLTGTIGDSLLLHSYCSMLLLDTSPMCLCVCVYLYVYTHTHTKSLFQFSDPAHQRRVTPFHKQKLGEEGYQCLEACGHVSPCGCRLGF